LWLCGFLFFTFHQNPFVYIFFCHKLWVFKKFYISSSSFVMNNTIWILMKRWS
jgi:hypothetical protein